MTKSCQHKPPPDLGLLGGCSDGNDRAARGEKQGYCPFCCKWIWSYLFFTRTDFIEAMEAGESVLAATAYQEHRNRRRR